MSNPLRTSEDYELFLYTLTEQFPVVRSSEYTFVPERYELEWEKALCSVEAVREFLQALPGDRATLGDSVVRFLSKR